MNDLTLVGAIAEFFTNYGNASNAAQGVINWYWDYREDLLTDYDAGKLAKQACEDLEFYGMINTIAMREFFDQYRDAVLYELELELEG